MRGIEFQKPTDFELRQGFRTLGLWRAVVSPYFEGLDRIPDERPLLFVGNHTLFGVLDAPLLFAELYERKGLFLRALGDHFHFQVPLWRTLLHRYGVVDGTPENCAALMRAGEAVLVFPGGGREVAKRKGERYTLLWKERMGFARLAIAHRCTIVPFAAVGADDAFDVLMDAEDLLASPVGPIVRRLIPRTEVIMPLAKGLGPTPLPRPDRFYFHFGDPIPTRQFDGNVEESIVRDVRDRTRNAVENGLSALLSHRAHDPERHFTARARHKLQSLLGR